MKHPEYRSTAKYNDIALLELVSPVRTDEGIVKPICLPTVGFTQVNHSYIIAGWGYVNRTTVRLINYAWIYVITWTFYKEISERLLKADLTEHVQSYCISKFKSVAQPNSELSKGIISSQICAENPTSKADTDCQGNYLMNLLNLSSFISLVNI